MFIEHLAYIRNAVYMNMVPCACKIFIINKQYICCLHSIDDEAEDER